MKYDVMIIGAGPGGIFAAYEFVQKKPDLKIIVFEAGHELSKRHYINKYLLLIKGELMERKLKLVLNVNLVQS